MNLEERFVDLHLHSSYSDGTNTPREILEIALKRNIGIMAITDHDCLEGTRELMALGGDYGMVCIPGVELTGIEDGESFHILGYGIDLEDENFQAFVKQNGDLLNQVNLRLIRKMAETVPGLTMENYEQYHWDRRRGGWKALYYLVDRGFAPCARETIRLYGKYGCGFETVDFPGIEEICRQIHLAGGKAVWAHPGKQFRDDAILAKQVPRVMERFPLDGMECYYHSHSPQQQKICLDYCREHGFLITCGSDSHGDFELEAIPMATPAIYPELLDLREIL